MASPDHDKNGRFKKGNKASPGRPKKENTLTDLIRAALSEDAVCYFEDNLPRVMPKRDVMAKHIADMVVYGRVVLPTEGMRGAGVEQRVLHYNSDAFMKHIIKLLRYIERESDGSDAPGGVTNIIFDVPIARVREMMQDREYIDGEAREIDDDEDDDDEEPTRLLVEPIDSEMLDDNEI